MKSPKEPGRQTFGAGATSLGEPVTPPKYSCGCEVILLQMNPQGEDSAAFECELVVFSSGEHLSQLFTGFASLRRRGAIQATMHRGKRFEPGIIGARLDVVLNGRFHLVYDLTDGGTIDPRHGIDIADIYFKRSYDPNAIAHSEAKIFPLGLNFPVYGPGDWNATRLRWSLALLRPHNAKAVAIRVTRLSKILSHVFKANGGRSPCWIDRFPAEPRVNRDPKVLFLTRTWPAHGRLDAATADERREITSMRVRCIRLLRSELGPTLLGGLLPSEDAIRDFPDCVVDQAITRKPNYLKSVKQSDVCIATKGLRESNGWSIGEYVASARAIVTEPLRYTVPGNFSPGRNYLEMTSPEECVEQTLRLLSDSPLRGTMMQANQHYYQAFVRPDSLVWNSLSTAAAHLGIDH